MQNQCDQLLREQLLKVSQQLASLGLNRGTSGNASVRANNELGQSGFLITPSGMAADKMTLSDIVWMDFAGNAVGIRQPSSEWRFHLLISRRSMLSSIHIACSPPP